MATSPDVFTHVHIALTAAATAILSGAIAAWRLRGHRIVDSAAVAAVVGLSVYLWRASANLPQLNHDGISGYSANDWLAPVIVFVALSVYADLRPPPDARRYGQVRAAATVEHPPVERTPALRW